MKPDHAASIWVDADLLHLELPSTIPKGQAHTISLPNTSAGLRRALAILAERGPSSTLSTKGAPTQIQATTRLADAWLRKNKIKKAKPPPQTNPELRATVRDILRKHGIIGAVRR